MESTQDHQINHFDDELDHSIQQQHTEIDTPDEGFHFQHEEIHHDQDHSDHYHHEMRDGQFQEENVFHYSDDYRMRQSMKSEEDYELEDVSGNADMTDRHQLSSKKTIQKVSIVDYETKPHQDTQVNEKSSNPQPKKAQQIQQQTLSTESQQAPISITENSKIMNTITNSPNKQSPVTLNFIKQQPFNFAISKKQDPSTPQIAKVQTPKKQIVASPKQSSHKKPQSNKAYSPMPEQDIYDSPIKKNKDEQKLAQKNQQKPKISFLNQSDTIVQSQSNSSSIRDWFRSSTSKSSSISQKNTPKGKEQTNQDLKQKYKREVEAEMLGIQQNLTKHQKVNKIFGATQKQKEKQKINKTHFAQPSSKLFNSQSDDTSKDEYKMLLKISFQKKKQNYHMLKEWDKVRAENMNIHRNMIELLQSEVDKRIKLSLQNFEIYTNFFKQKMKQQQKFINSPVINTKYALQNNSISKNIYINCSVILNSLSEENQAKCKKIQDFITLIKNSVLKDLMQKHLHESQKQLLKVREKISTLKNSLKKYNSQTEEKSQALAALFVQSSKSASITAQNDFYAAQLQFLRSAGQQVLIQKKLGQNCLQYYTTALNEQFKRAKIIKQALLTYSKGLKQTYSMSLQEVELEQLSKDEEIKLITQFYNVEDMFDERSSQLIKAKCKLSDQQDLKIDNVSRFVSSFQFDIFNSRMLTLKQFNAKYFSVISSKDAKSPRQETCYLVITVDFYLHLFFSMDKSMVSFKPDVTLKIGSKQLQIRQQKQQFIDIIKKQQRRGSMISYFWQSKNEKSYRIKFSSKDAKQQFCDYVRKLMF